MILMQLKTTGSDPTLVCREGQVYSMNITMGNSFRDEVEEKMKYL